MKGLRDIMEKTYEPGPRYHVHAGDKNVGDEKGYSSPGLAHNALKALKDHEKMHVVRRDAEGKVMRRWDHTGRMVEGLDSHEKIRSVWSQREPKGMYAKTHTGSVYRLNARATGGKIPSVGDKLDVSQHERVKRVDEDDYTLHFHQSKGGRRTLRARVGSLGKKWHTFGIEDHHGTNDEIAHRVAGHLRRQGHSVRFGADLRTEAHTLDQLEKRRKHHNELGGVRRRAADAYEREALKHMGSDAETYFNNKSDKYNRKAHLHGRAWDAATRLIARKKGIAEDEYTGSKRYGGRAIAYINMKDGQPATAHDHGILAVAKAMGKVRMRFRGSHAGSHARLRKPNSGWANQGPRAAGTGYTLKRHARGAAIYTEEDEMRRLTLKDILEGKTGRFERKKDKRHDGGEHERRARKRDVEVEEATDVGEISMTRKGAAHAHGILAVARALHGGKTRLSGHRDAFRRVMKKQDVAHAKHAHVSIDDSVELEDFANRLEELHGKGTLEKIKRYHDIKSRGHAAIVNDLEDTIDEARGRPRKHTNVQGGDAQEDPDNHIVVHLRKAISLRGGHPVAFQHGKAAHVAPSDAHLALLRHDELHPRHREEYARRLGHSYDSFRRAIAH